jgi:protein-S-isoprenylcysteine O-methyltransferase Ste14
MIVYLIGTPLALGSYWGLLAVVAMVPLLMWRLLDEEKLLINELQGYTEYQQQVRRRLVPYIW